jgi:hypothetical protein
MALKNYSQLPDFMPSSEIEYCIEEVLDTASSDPKISVIEVANALLTMIERQSNNYDEKFSDNTVSRMQQWVLASWSLSSPSLVDILSTILVNLEHKHPFREGYKLLESSLHTEHLEIKQIVKETLAEMPNKYY